MPGGRPPKLTARLTIPPLPETDTRPARPARTVTYAQAIHERIRATGCTASLAARHYGISSAAVHRWMHDGRRHTERRDAGRQLIPAEVLLIEFVEGCDRSYAEWVLEKQDLHAQVADGGLVVGEVVEKFADDGVTLLERRVTHKRALPDARAIEWELEHLARREGYGNRLEVTGADGGPLEVDARTDRQETAERLLAEAEAMLAGAAARAELDTEDAGEVG